MSSIQLKTVFLITAFGLNLYPVYGGVELQSETLDLDLKSGSQHQIPMKAVWTGTEPVNISLNGSVSAETTDSEGIYIDIYPKNIVLEPEEQSDISVRLTTSFGLVPDNFSLSVKAFGPDINTGLDNTRKETQNTGGSGSSQGSSGSGGGLSLSAGTNEDKSVSDQETQTNRDNTDQKDRESEFEKENELNQTSNPEENSSLSKPEENQNRILGFFLESRATTEVIVGLMVSITAAYFIYKLRRQSTDRQNIVSR